MADFMDRGRDLVPSVSFRQGTRQRRSRAEAPSSRQSTRRSRAEAPSSRMSSRGRESRREEQNQSCEATSGHSGHTSRVRDGDGAPQTDDSVRNESDYIESTMDDEEAIAGVSPIPLSSSNTPNQSTDEATDGDAGKLHDVSPEISIPRPVRVPSSPS